MGFGGDAGGGLHCDGVDGGLGATGMDAGVDRGVALAGGGGEAASLAGSSQSLDAVSSCCHRCVEVVVQKTTPAKNAAQMASPIPVDLVSHVHRHDMPRDAPGSSTGAAFAGAPGLS